MTQTTHKVLIVEDNEDNLVIFRTVLQQAGYDVLTAGDGETGIESARAQEPDLILMDLAIPVVDGWEATRRLKSDAATRDIPIIVLTAYALSHDEEQAKEVGCDDFLTKPIEPSDLVAAVRRLID